MSDSTFKLIASIIMLVCVLCLSALFGLPRLFSKQVVSITVKEKLAVMEEGSYKYLIYDTNEVFENTDELWAGKFNSSDVYNQLQVGKTYRVQVMGWRVQWLSWYRNIISIQP